MVFQSTLYVLDFPILYYKITTLRFKSRLCSLPQVHNYLENLLKRDALCYWAIGSNFNF
jgi:hypothetical protein